MRNNCSLFINTATKQLQFGLLKDDKFTFLEAGTSKKALEFSLSTINKLLKENDTSLKDVREFYTLLGPGSNTGIRLGLAIVRTIYGVDNTISMFGINTLKVYLTDKKGLSLLSDRAGNLFAGYYKDDQFVNEKILKDETNKSSLLDKDIYVDFYDNTTIELLKDKKINTVSIIDNMFKMRDEFDNYSSKIDEYLPIYQFKI